MKSSTETSQQNLQDEFEINSFKYNASDFHSLQEQLQATNPLCLRFKNIDDTSMRVLSALLNGNFPQLNRLKALSFDECDPTEIIKKAHFRVTLLELKKIPAQIIPQMMQNLANKWFSELNFTGTPLDAIVATLITIGNYKSISKFRLIDLGQDQINLIVDYIKGHFEKTNKPFYSIIFDQSISADDIKRVFPELKDKTVEFAGNHLTHQKLIFQLRQQSKSLGNTVKKQPEPSAKRQKLEPVIGLESKPGKHLEASKPVSKTLKTPAKPHVISLKEEDDDERATIISVPKKNSNQISVLNKLKDENQTLKNQIQKLQKEKAVMQIAFETFCEHLILTNELQDKSLYMAENWAFQLSQKLPRSEFSTIKTIAAPPQNSSNLTLPKNVSEVATTNITAIRSQTPSNPTQPKNVSEVATTKITAAQSQTPSNPTLPKNVSEVATTPISAVQYQRGFNFTPQNPISNLTMEERQEILQSLSHLPPDEMQKIMEGLKVAQMKKMQVSMMMSQRQALSASPNPMRQTTATVTPAVSPNPMRLAGNLSPSPSRGPQRLPSGANFLPPSATQATTNQRTTTLQPVVRPVTTPNALPSRSPVHIHISPGQQIPHNMSGGAVVQQHNGIAPTPTRLSAGPQVSVIPSNSSPAFFVPVKNVQRPPAPGRMPQQLLSESERNLLKKL